MNPTTEQRELLDLAARAVGFGDGPHDFDKRTGWNPLEKDDDALWLAVKLGANVEYDMSFVRCGWSAGRSGAPTRDGKGPWYWCERLTDSPDPCAATRLAIVRAAAAIAKGEKE